MGVAIYELHRPLWTILGPWLKPCSEGLGIMNPRVVCVFVYLCVCLYVRLYVSLCVLVFLTSYKCLYMSLYVYVCQLVCFHVSVSVVEGDVYFCVTVCLRMHLCVSACVHVQ